MAVARIAALFALVGPLLLLAAGVQPKELEDWFASADGLAMTRQDAVALASRTWNPLTQCGVTVPKLAALKAVMYDHAGMDLAMPELRRHILLLAEQHVSPDRLGQFYKALSTSYTLSGGLALPKVEAQTRAVEMSMARADPDQLYGLYKVMYGYQGLGFDQKTAQQLAQQQALAGADAAQFKESYTQAKGRGASAPQATQEAVVASINANLNGLVRRYARDTKPYTAPEFQQYFGVQWLSEWLAAPLEMHVSGDRVAHTASQFKRHYGSSWAEKYRASLEATQVRFANDAKAYDIQEYQQYYGNAWQQQWAASPELPCKQCAPYKAVRAAAAELLV